MKIITHIASFSGNYGDLINHKGFYELFDFRDCIIERIEIRKFYNNYNGYDKGYFDKALADKINKSNLLILGGGGFFDVYWDKSPTGTTFQMTREFVDSIKIPVVINAMGVHFSKEHEEAKEKFYKFFGYINKLDNWMVNIRNDGSRLRMEKVYSQDIMSGVNVVPDNGFFSKREFLSDDGEMIGINLTSELSDYTYVNNEALDVFYKKISNYILDLIYNHVVCFFIHTPQDIFTLSIILNNIGNERLRSNVKLAPFHPFYSKDYYDVIDYYRACKVIIAMRFHANVLGLRMKKPIVGLSIHDQIEGLYNEIDLKSSCVRVGSNNYIERLKTIVNQYLNNKDDIILNEKNVMDDIRNQSMRYKENAMDFIKQNGETGHEWF